MKRLLYILALACGVALLASCGGGAKRSAPEKSYSFRHVQPPVQVTDGNKFAWMQEHYWDSVDFADTMYVHKADTTEMIRAYAAYVANFVGPMNQEPIRRLMQRASVSRQMFDYFVMLAEQVLHDPNSPFRSEELYIPVLEAQLASPYRDEWERIAPAYDLRQAMQNRVGHKANDFRYTVASGRTASLYGMKYDYVLVVMNNPGCPMCRTVEEAVVASPLLTQLQSEGRLKVLAVYPDEDLAAWRDYAPEMPAGWINAYDKGCLIREKELYDLRAIPAMYLLDADKRVLVRDSTSAAEIETVIAHDMRSL